MSLTEYKPGSAFGRMGRTVGESDPAWPAPVRSTPGAPNVLYIVLDDTGYGQLKLLRLADQHPQPGPAGAERASLYEHAHHGASPSRSCLLTRAQPPLQLHGVHHRGVNRLPGFQRQSRSRTDSCPSCAAPPRLCHVLRRQMAPHPGGTDQCGRPHDRWPLGRGFDRYYGFLGGDTTRHDHLGFFHNPHQVEPPKTPEEGYHLTVDLADKAIEFIADLKQVAPDKPFFLYFATGANHAPHQVPKEWADKYKGKFDDGWDAYRERCSREQKELGIVAEDVVLSRHDPDVQQWDELSDDERRLYARMSSFRWILRAHRYQIGRLLDFLEEIGQLDNTLVMVISETTGQVPGRPARLGQREQVLQQRARRPAAEPRRAGRTRRTEVLQPLPVGLDLRGNTPFRRWKRETYRGGVSDPFLVHWPKGIKAKGEIRTQYAHAIDMVPTVLESLGLEAPTEIRGVAQSPIEGVSFAQACSATPARGPTTTPSTSRCSPVARSITMVGGRCVLSPECSSPGRAASACSNSPRTSCGSWMPRAGNSTTSRSIRPRPTTWPSRSARSSSR